MGLAMHILGNREDAEDACQDAFIQVFRNLEKYDFRRSFSTWFYSILYKRCLDRLKKRRRLSRLNLRLKNDPGWALKHEPSRSPEGAILRKNLWERLTSRERLSLYLWAGEGYTSREIAGVLRCSASTARVHVYRARKKIKALMEKENDSL